MKKGWNFCFTVLLLIIFILSYVSADDSILENVQEILSGQAGSNTFHSNQENNSPVEDYLNPSMSMPVYPEKFMASSASAFITILSPESGDSYPADYLQMEIHTSSEANCFYSLNRNQSQEKMFSSDGIYHYQTITGLENNLLGDIHRVDFNCIDGYETESSAYAYFLIDTFDLNKYLITENIGQWSYFGSREDELDIEDGVSTMYSGAYYLGSSQEEIIVNMMSILIFDSKDSIKNSSLYEDGEDISIATIGNKKVYLVNVSEGTVIFWSNGNKIIMNMILSPDESSLISFMNPLDYPLDALTSYLQKYPSDICIPNWVKESNQCKPDNKRLVSYYDSNSCEIILNLPLNNDTYEDCDFSDLAVISPDNRAYNSGRLSVNIQSSEKLSKLEFIDNSASSPRWTTLCTNCDSYNQLKSFGDGGHNLTFRGTFEGQTMFNQTSFFVDSKKPQISATKPASGKYTNGSNFYIKYSESNCKSVGITIIGQQSGGGGAGACESGKNVEKFISQGLRLFDGEEVEYRFAVEDIAGNIKESKFTKVKVDTIAPEIKDLEAPISGRYVHFNMVILNEDKNSFNKVEYLDNSKFRKQWRSLCTSLKDNNCYKKVYFKAGNWNITVRATDKAGNSEEKVLALSIA